MARLPSATVSDTSTAAPPVPGVPDPSGPTPPRRWAPSRLLAALGVGIVLVLTAVLHRTHPNALVTLLPSTDMTELHVDFDTFWQSSVALLNGQDIYDTPAKLTNLNPPLLSVLLAPFAALDPLTAYRVFATLTLLLILAAVLVVVRELRLSRGWAVAATLALLASSPLHGTLLLGQIYGLLLVGLVAGWVAERRGYPVLAAVLYGVTVALKPSLAPILVLPLVQRRWRPFAAGIAGAVVATLVGVLVAGFESGPEWIRIAITEPVPDVLDNAALPGLTLRLGITSAVGSALGAVLLIGTLAWFWRRTLRFGIDAIASVAHGTDPAGTAPWAVVAAGLLFSPIAWHNYLLLLLPGLLVLIAAAPAGSPRRAWGAVLLTLPVIPVSWGDLWAPENPWSPVGRSLYCAILLAYWFTLVRPGAPVRTGRVDARV
ncbi:MAG: hypothetical protein QOJ30_1110 [Pseudonocardiales bacterium]|nr:hypothetical protein [Pseudonocardiales bacterium]